jgi:GxxExxY protein
MKSEEPRALNEISGNIIGAAMRVHSVLGPGLFENVYELCLAYDLEKSGFGVRRQIVYPVVYDVCGSSGHSESTSWSRIG